MDKHMVLQHAALYGYEWHLPGVARGFLGRPYVVPARGLSQRQLPVEPLLQLRVPVREDSVKAKHGRGWFTVVLHKPLIPDP